MNRLLADNSHEYQAERKQYNLFLKGPAKTESESSAAYIYLPYGLSVGIEANSADPDQTAPTEVV